jgi:hypothetical protein
LEPKLYLLIIFYNYVLIIKGARIAQSVYRRATGWMAWVRFPAGERDFSILHSVQNNAGATPSLLFNEYLGLFPKGLSGWGVKLTTHLHLIPMSRMVDL